MSFDGKPLDKVFASHPSTSNYKRLFVESFVEEVSSSIMNTESTGKTLVVGVSGGPDSTALLVSLFSLRKKLGINLHVAHLDHCLRKTSKNDELFVSNLAKELDLPYSTKRINVKLFASRHTLSIEEAARKVRYKFFSDLLKEIDGHAIVLGHTKDDQAETILLHLVRGSGLRGVRGMSFSSYYLNKSGDKVKLIRPLLSLERRETQDFCKLLRIFPRFDETNTDPSIPRNYIRLKILPMLALLNPQVNSAFIRLGETATRDLDYIESDLDQIWDQLITEEPGSLKFQRSKLLSHHLSIQFHLLERAYASLHKGRGTLTTSLLKQVIKAVKTLRPKTIELPGGIGLKLTDQSVILINNSKRLTFPTILGSHRMNTQGQTIVPYSNNEQEPTKKFPDWKFRAQFVTKDGPLSSDPLVAYLDFEKLGVPLAIRSRTPGDRFSPLGIRDITLIPDNHQPIFEPIGNNVSRGKKLQDFLINSKVPVEIRDSIPLVISKGNVAWVVGWRIAEWARVTAKTKQILRLQGYPPIDGLVKA